MKKIYISTCINLPRVAALFIALFLFFGSVNAQNILAKWPLVKSKTIPQPPAGLLGCANVATGVNTGAGLLVYDNVNTFSAATPNAQGAKFKTINSNVWPSKPLPDATNPDFNLAFTLSPTSGYDLNITGITLTDTLGTSTTMASGVVIGVAPYYQIDGKGPWIAFGTPQTFTQSPTTYLDFGSFNQSFFSKSANGSTHTYVIKLSFYTTTPSVTTKGDYFYLSNLVFYGTANAATSAPKVITSTAVATGKYTGTATGTYDFGATVQNPSSAGVTWSTNANPTLATSPFTKDGSGGNINSVISGLLANTTYHVRAYAVTPLDTIYGQDLTLKTDPYTAPVVTTTTAANVLSNKANVGGVIVDSGGVAIINKVIKYGTSYSVINTIKPTVITGSDPFSITLTQLLPSTKYYYQVCVTNSIGTTCGKIDSFTTSVAVPALSATPSVIDFGDLIYNITAPVLSYTLTGSNLNPASGNITVNLSPASGFIISTSSTKFSATPITSISIPYTGGKLKKVIYVKLLTSNYGNFNSAISHSGGGVATIDADTVKLTGNIISSPDQLSNVGSDFWTGFAYHNAMKDVTTQFDTFPKGNSAGQAAAAGAHFSVFLAGGSQGDTVVVDLPGIPNAATFPRKVYVPANGFVEVGGFPVGDGQTRYNASGAPDARLFTTGVSKRGIHIYSKSGVPVSAWMYDWQTGDAAGGSMLFPSNTWNSSYIVQAVGGKANNSGYFNNSYFFVIAKDDNTVVTFTPTNDILDSNVNTIFTNGHLHTPAYVKYNKGTQYSVTLNKGEVFNAMGFVGDPTPTSADPGALDLSGTLVSTTCDKKIAVFGGNGRCVIGTVGDIPQVNNTSACTVPTSGSDNLVQQMFPKVAWGTTYLTIPTKNMADNMFRVYVQDPATTVKLNGVALLKANLVNGLYYQFDVNRPAKIEGDKPISVTQFILSGACNGPTYGNIGKGDPEMITLSPVQQSIKNVTVYSATFKNGNKAPGSGGCYINVVVKGIEGVNSFLLDGLQTGVDTGSNTFTGSVYGHAPASPPGITMTKAFKAHPYDANYYFATFWVSSPAKHTLSSSQGFNAIAYGVSDGESYGYNAGTAINNLSSIKIAENPTGQDTSSSVVRTCKNNLVRLQIALPYLPSQVDKIVWTAPNNSNINLSGSSYDGPTMTDPNNASKTYADTSGSIVVDGQTFYIYTSPVQYQFSDYGFYPMVATAYGTFSSDCGGQDAQKIYVQVTSDNIDFKAEPAGCGSTNVKFTDGSTAMSGASIVKWIWDFGDGKTETITNISNPNPTTNPHVYPGLNAYTAKLTTISSIGCSSTDNVYLDLAFGIKAQYVMDRDTVCPNSAVAFTDSSNNAASWKWDFGEPSSATNTSTLQNPSHTYTTTGIHTVTLQVFSSSGCSSNVFSDTVYVSPLPKPSFTFGGVCLPGSTVFTNTSDTATGNTPYTYAWNFGEATSTSNTATTTDGKHTYTPPVPAAGYTVKLTATNRFGCSDSISQAVTTIYTKPVAIITPVTNNICFGDSTAFTDASTAIGQTINKWSWDFGDTSISTIQNPKHKFSAVNSYTVKLSITTDKGCTSDTFTSVKISPLPVAGFILPGSCLGSGSVTFIDTSKISDASLKPFTYSWSFGDPTSANNSSTAQDGTHTYTGVGSYTVKETVTATNSCNATASTVFEIAGSRPVPGFEIVGGTTLCSNLPVQLKDTSRIAIGTIKRVEIVWDAIGKPLVVEIDTLSPSNGTVGTSKTYTHKYPELSKDKTYTVKLIAYSGTTCSDVTTQTVTVHGTPVVVFPAQSFICANASPRNITEAKENAGLPGAFAYSGVGITGISFDPTKGFVGKDTITAIYTTTAGCKDTATTFTPVMDTVGIRFSLRSVNMCLGDSIVLSPKSTAREYSWTELDAPNNTFLKGTTSQNVWVKPTNDITTYVVVANASHCPTTDSITVYAAPLPKVSIVGPKEVTICYNDRITLIASTTAPNIKWTPADSLKSGNTSAIVIAAPRDTTKFVVKVSDTSYCTKSVSDTVIVNVRPFFGIGIHVGSDTSTLLTPGDSLTMMAYVTDTAFKQKLKYSWSPSTFLDNKDTSTPVLYPVLRMPDSQTYLVTATDSSGCKDTASIKIYFYKTKPEVLVPSAFTPNGDGKNDVLTPFPVGIAHFKYFKVFNRSGQLVFSTTQIGEGWDGTINGQPADPGTYIWIAEGIDYKNHSLPNKGFVVLMR